MLPYSRKPLSRDAQMVCSDEKHLPIRRRIRDFSEGNDLIDFRWKQADFCQFLPKAYQIFWSEMLLVLLRGDTTAFRVAAIKGLKLSDLSTLLRECSVTVLIFTSCSTSHVSLPQPPHCRPRGIALLKMSQIDLWQKSFVFKKIPRKSVKSFT